MSTARQNPRLHTLRIDGRTLEYQRLHSAHPVAGQPPLVFLHEGLGCIAMWRDFPQRVADATGCAVVVYSRYGHGKSAPLAQARRGDYLHDEALNALPEFLARLELERPLLFGHSDGASIALIHASAGHPVSGLIVEAPHVMVEDITLAGIAATVSAYANTDLPSRLGRHHRNADALFRGWSETWLDPAFRNWNIESGLRNIAAPILAIQGEGDEYATMAQIERIAAAAADVELLKLADCGHSPHRDQAETVIDAVRRFVARCAAD